MCSEQMALSQKASKLKESNVQFTAYFDMRLGNGNWLLASLCKVKIDANRFKQIFM